MGALILNFGHRMGTPWRGSANSYKMGRGQRVLIQGGGGEGTFLQFADLTVQIRLHIVCCVFYKHHFIEKCKICTMIPKYIGKKKLSDN